MMRWTSTVAAVAVVLVAGIGSAQTTGGAPESSPPGQGAAPGSGTGAMGPGMMGGPCAMMGQWHGGRGMMMGPGMGRMGRGMMGRGGMMGPGMGMMADEDLDPKTRGRLMQLRGEMLKTLGDALIQRGKALEEGK